MLMNGLWGLFKSFVVCLLIGNILFLFWILYGLGKVEGMFLCSLCVLNVIIEDRVCFDKIFFFFKSCCILLYFVWIDVCNVCNFLKFIN